MKQIAELIACGRCGKDVEMTERVWEEVVGFWAVTVLCASCDTIERECYWKACADAPASTETDEWLSPHKPSTPPV